MNIQLLISIKNKFERYSCELSGRSVGGMRMSPTLCGGFSAQIYILIKIRLSFHGCIGFDML